MANQLLTPLLLVMLSPTMPVSYGLVITRLLGRAVALSTVTLTVFGEVLRLPLASTVKACSVWVPSGKGASDSGTRTLQR